MANDLTSPTTLSMPRWLRSSLDSVNLMGPPKIPAEKSLSLSQRAVVEGLLAEAEAMLEAGPLERTTEHLSDLLGTFPAKAGTEAARAKGFRIALEDLPAWAIEAAVRKWLRGEDGEGTEDYSFAPSPPQLRRLALRARNGFEGKVILLRRLLAAQVIDDNALAYVEPAKVSAVLENLSQSLGAKVAPLGEKEAERREAKAWLENEHARVEKSRNVDQFPEAAE